MKDTIHSLAFGFLHLGLEVTTPIGSFSLLPMRGSQPADLIEVGTSDRVFKVLTSTLPAHQRLILGLR